MKLSIKLSATLLVVSALGYAQNTLTGYWKFSVPNGGVRYLELKQDGEPSPASHMVVRALPSPEHGMRASCISKGRFLGPGETAPCSSTAPAAGTNSR